MPRFRPSVRSYGQLRAIQGAACDREFFELLELLRAATSIGVLAQNQDNCLLVCGYVSLRADKREHQHLERLWPSLCKALAASLPLLTNHVHFKQQQQQPPPEAFQADEQV
jgi:hypothetical protein